MTYCHGEWWRAAWRWPGQREGFFFFSRIRFSFRIFKMRGFVSPAVHHSNAYPAQSCKSATLTRVTTGSQHDFIMPWCKDDTIYQNSRLCIVKFSYSPSQEDTQQIIQLYLLGLKDYIFFAAMLQRSRKTGKTWKIWQYVQLKLLFFQRFSILFT